MSNQDMAQRIKELREINHLTLEQVAKVVGVGKSTVRKWETGMIANMRRDKIAALARALNTTPAYLMGWECKSKEAFSFSDHEKDLILAYRARPEMQGAVNTLLGIPNGPSIADDVSSVLEEAAAFQTEPIESK